MEILAFVGVCIVVCVLRYRYKLYYHFRVVDKGKVYRSGKLSQKGFELVCKRFGIKTVVNLVEQGQHDKQWFQGHKSFCDENGINLIPIPLTSPPQNLRFNNLLMFATIAIAIRYSCIVCRACCGPA